MFKLFLNIIDIIQNVGLIWNYQPVWCEHFSVWLTRRWINSCSPSLLCE